MGDITFRIRKFSTSDLNKPLSIYFRYNIPNKVDFRKSIKAKVKLTDWDSKKEEVKNRSNIPNRSATNNLITRLREYFIEFDNKNIEKGIQPSTKDVELHFNNYFSNENKPIEKDFIELHSEFIIEKTHEINPKTGKALSKGTIASHQQTNRVLVEFSKNNYNLNFENVNLEFYYDLLKYLEKKKYSQNNIGKHVKNIKTFISWAINKELITKSGFLSSKVVVFNKTAETVYLNNSEIELIANLDLEKHKLEVIRDLFFIGVYTGLRISDYSSITENNIINHEGNKFLKVSTKKTNKVVVIPLHHRVDQILTKYNNKPPKVSEPHFNRAIKELGKLAGINEPITITKTKGGKTFSRAYEKYLLLQSHTARRTFCTNAYLADMPTIDIMAISGHTSEKTFLSYIKVTPEQRAIKLSTHKFFNSSNLKVV